MRLRQNVMLRVNRTDSGSTRGLGGEHPGVARNQATVLAHQRRRRPAPFLDARGDRGDLRIRVGPSVFRVWDQPINRPPLDLVGRPRPLIFTADSRAGARARETGEVLALLRAGRPAPGRAPPRAIDYSYGLNLFKAPAVPEAHAAPRPRANQPGRH